MKIRVPGRQRATARKSDGRRLKRDFNVLGRYATESGEQTVLENMKEYLLNTIQRTFEVSPEQAECLYQELLECTRRKNLVSSLRVFVPYARTSIYVIHARHLYLYIYIYRLCAYLLRTVRVMRAGGGRRAAGGGRREKGCRKAVPSED